MFHFLVVLWFGTAVLFREKMFNCVFPFFFTDFLRRAAMSASQNIYRGFGKKWTRPIYLAGMIIWYLNRVQHFGCHENPI